MTCTIPIHSHRSTIATLPCYPVLDHFRDSFLHTLAHIRTIREEELFTVGYYAWTRDASLAAYAAVHTCDHYLWAKQHLRSWSHAHRATPGRPLSKAGLLEQIAEERRKLEATLARINRSDMAKPGVTGEWSVKDVVVHLVDWEQRFLGWYAAGLRGEVPETPAPGMNWSAKSLGLLNQQIYEKHRDRSLDDVLAESGASYAQTFATVQAIPEADMFAPGHYAWTGNGTLAGFIAANTSNHYRWARSLIRKWMKTQGDAVPAT